MITVFADQYLYKLKEIIPRGINLRLYDPAKGLPDCLDEADALLLRTVTSLNKETLPKIPEKLKFVGSGSAGTDHVDIEYLQKNNVSFAHSAGCNARAVAEYVVTSLIIWSEDRNIEMDNETIGIIGVGKVGTALQQILNTLGWTYKLFDPPRAERDSSFTSSTISEVLNCSILSFHTPLIFNGKYPTHHWLNQQKLENCKFDLVLNTSRGGVIDEKALLQAVEMRQINDIIIDVWENEPAFKDQTASTAFLATPHIAGYSIQAKFRATKMIVDALIQHFSLHMESCVLDMSPEIIEFDTEKIENLSITNVIKRIHPICTYHTQLHKLIGLPNEKKSRKFRNLRIALPYRNEFSHLRISPGILKKYSLLRQLSLEPTTKV